ncbi:MAG: hypothetical protein ACRDE5_15005 [Ginsengibacter sp.]
MRKISTLIIFTCFLIPAFSQKLAHIIIDNRGTSDVISFAIDESIFFNLTKDGKIIDWGVEDDRPGPKFFPPKLAKYMGREEYYSATDDEAYRGKIKYLGSALITYYTANDNEALKGKIKMIGSNFFTYYTAYDDAAFKGNIKTAGPVSFTYYASYDDESYRGKIKTVGATSLAYYGMIDDKAFRGKIKNIDRNAFTYYSSYDRKEYSGMPKTPNQMAVSGGVQFLVKNY